MSQQLTVQEKRDQDLKEFKHNLSRLIEAGELALPSNVTTDAFRNAAIVAVQDNPEILSCTPASVMKSIRTIAAAGLVPDGREAAIVPFFTKEGRVAQGMPMVFGLIKMARRSGDVKDIRAHIVYQNEVDQGQFEYVVGDEESLTHKPILFGDKGPPVAAYAIAKLSDGGIVRAFMDSAEIDKVRRSSPQQRKHDNPNGIWQSWSEEMWKKTVIRRLCKRLDLSAEDMRRILVEQDPPDFKDVTPKETAPRKNLAAALRETADPEAPEHITGEIMPDDDPHWTETVDLSDAFPGSEEFSQGRAGFEAGVPLTKCPYEKQPDKAADWIGGWKEAAKGGEA